MKKKTMMMNYLQDKILTNMGHGTDTPCISDWFFLG